MPGFKSYKRKMTLLISSPKVQVYYHCDVPGQTLWQMRGTKRVYVYPNTAPFLPQPNMEKIVLGEAHENAMPYEPWYDDYAKVIDLKPGRDAALAAQLPAPRRQRRLPQRLVHDRAMDGRAAQRLRGQLRQRRAAALMGRKSLRRPASGAGLYARLGLAAAHKYLGLQAKRRSGFKIDFKVDPTAPFSVRNVPAFELRK